MTRLDLFAVLARHPETGELLPFGINGTEDGAYKVAAEAVDAVTLSHSILPPAKRLAAVALCETIRVVPAVLLFEEGMLHG